MLGCFDLLGKWTTERSLCDPNQMKYLFPPSSQASSQTSINILPVQPVPPVETQTSSISDAQRMEEEAAIRRMIEERLISEAERQQVRQRLLANVADAIARLTQLMEQQSLPAEIAEKVTGTVTWLQQVALSALPGTASLGDMQIQAEALRGRLTETQAMISTALRERGVATTYNPLTLTEKFDRFFAAIPPAITLLQAEGAVVPATAITSFNEAKQIFEQLKPGCIQDSSTCGKLAAVIPPLEQCTDALKASIASTGRDDLEQKIDLLLQK